MNRVSRAGVLIVALALGAFLIHRPSRWSVPGRRWPPLRNSRTTPTRHCAAATSTKPTSFWPKPPTFPTIRRFGALAGSANLFEQQRKEFASEREEQYKKALGNVELLIDKNHPDYAIDAAARAYLLASDKAKFRRELGVEQLVRGSISHAADYDRNEQWIKSLRIYSDLSGIEPSIPAWKDKLKLATRRVTLLALYAPDAFKTLQDGDQKERDEVEVLLKPATQPATPKTPATQPADKDTDNFKVDWRDTLRGVRMDMLRAALEDARTNYYREVSYKQLALGGLNGIQAVVSTPGPRTGVPRPGRSGQEGAIRQSARR